MLNLWHNIWFLSKLLLKFNFEICLSRLVLAIMPSRILWRYIRKLNSNNLKSMHGMSIFLSDMFKNSMFWMWIICIYVQTDMRVGLFNYIWHAFLKRQLLHKLYHRAILLYMQQNINVNIQMLVMYLSICSFWRRMFKWMSSKLWDFFWLEQDLHLNSILFIKKWADFLRK